MNKPTRLLPAEGARNRWDHQVPHGVTPEQMLNPAYWSHVSSVLRPRDVIEVWAEDNSWSGEFVVLPGPTRADKGVIVVKRAVWQHEQPATAELLPVDEVFEVGFTPQQKWRVIRKSDHVVVGRDFASKELAEAAMRAMPRPAKVQEAA